MIKRFITGGPGEVCKYASVIANNVTFSGLHFFCSGLSVQIFRENILIVLHWNFYIGNFAINVSQPMLA